MAQERMTLTRLTFFRLMMLIMSSKLIPVSLVGIIVPLLSEREIIMAPSSIALRAAYWATFPEPEIATFLFLKVSLPCEAYWIIWPTYYRYQQLPKPY